MTEWVEQQIYIKFCVSLNILHGNYLIQKDFGDDAMSAVQINMWHKCFKDGQESVESDPVLEDLQQAEHLRMLSVYRLKSTKISN